MCFPKRGPSCWSRREANVRVPPQGSLVWPRGCGMCRRSDGSAQGSGHGHSPPFRSLGTTVCFGEPSPKGAGPVAPPPQLLARRQIVHFLPAPRIRAGNKTGPAPVGMRPPAKTRGKSKEEEEEEEDLQGGLDVVNRFCVCLDYAVILRVGTLTICH